MCSGLWVRSYFSFENDSRSLTRIPGFVGTICWTIQLVPQIWHTYRSKSVEGLSEHFMCALESILVLSWTTYANTFVPSVDRLLCAIAGPFLGTYSVVQNLNVPLILQPQVFGVLCLISWAQVRTYFHSSHARWC